VNVDAQGKSGMFTMILVFSVCGGNIKNNFKSQKIEFIKI